MKKVLLALSLTLLLVACRAQSAPETFRDQQLRFPRVRVAYAAVGPSVATLLRTPSGDRV